MTSGMTNKRTGKKEYCCVLHDVISRTSFRRQSRGDKSFFSTMSLHISNQYSKSEVVEWSFSLSFALWCLTSRWIWLLTTLTRPLGVANTATIENPPILMKELSSTQIYRCHLAPPRCRAQWQHRVTGLKNVDLSSPWTLVRWQVRLHGAFSIPRDTLGFSPKDQSCRHEGWLHLTFVKHHGDDAPWVKHDHQSVGPYKERDETVEDESDCSLSS